MSERSVKMLHVKVLLSLCWWTLVGVSGESVSVMEGDSVTLNSGLTELMDDDLIEWRFVNENTSIAVVDIMDTRVTVYDSTERFRNRLKVDHQTASLTITHTTTEHAGVYEIKYTGKRTKHFSLTVNTRLPVPVLIFNSSQCSSSVQYCSVLCSVVNVSAVSLSWYKGNSVLSSISVSDLSISLSLPLEVEYQDNNTYSCVINNTISNQTTHLDISTLCLTSCSEFKAHCCGFTETMIRLVLSALVGMATLAFLVFDIRSTGSEHKKPILLVL
ncbi:uncharacterized protein LOC100002635 precursor [Danio rerio]|uniref:Uncharacterized protein LOC100002635 precursor n=1 Tax=Danio rerio TaxID=7955 RepID=A0A8M1NH98_DANRE|nr:uncharacterized protein LOC100002635 precursor [Danio rerio]|eukprot:NP_001107117.2 SLAM family member precursor [Danio rerio]